MALGESDVRGIGSSVADQDRGIRDKHITRQERRILPFPANKKGKGGAGLGLR